MMTVSRSAEAANEYLDGFCATEVLQREVSQTQIVPSPNFSAKQNWYDLCFTSVLHESGICCPQFVVKNAISFKIYIL